MWEIIGMIIAVVIYLAIVILCLGAYLAIIGASLIVGLIIGAGYGIYLGCKNYIVSIRQNINYTN